MRWSSSQHTGCSVTATRPPPRTLRIPYVAREKYSPRADRSVPIPRSVMRRATSPRSYTWPRFRPGWACRMPRAGRSNRCRTYASNSAGMGSSSGCSRRPLSGPCCVARGPCWHLGTSPQRTRTPMPPWLGWPNLIFGTTPTLPISPWTSTASPPTAGGRRAGPRRRCPICTQPSRDMTMWSVGVSRSRRG